MLLSDAAFSFVSSSLISVPSVPLLAAAASLAAASAALLVCPSSRRLRVSTEITEPSSCLMTGPTLKLAPDGSCSAARRSACLTAFVHILCLSNWIDRSRLRSEFLLYLSGFLVYSSCSALLSYFLTVSTNHAAKYGGIELPLLFLICLSVSLFTPCGHTIFSGALLSLPFWTCMHF